MEEIKAKQTIDLIESKLRSKFKQIEDVALFNQQKVLNAFAQARVALSQFASSTGYGYEDLARPKLNELYAKVFKTEGAIVSPLITCGTHAIYLALSGVLRPGDNFISVTGDPYDTLMDSILKRGNGSLADFGISFNKVEMIGSKVNLTASKKLAKKLNPKLIYLQRSRGYSTRNSLSVDYIGEVISSLKEVCPNAIFMVDNCYGEFCETKEPTEVGADIIAGSLIKNIGGGIAPTGGYIAGKEKYINEIYNRLTCPSLGGEVGSYAGSYVPYFEGLFIAPHVVSGAIKGNLLLGKVAEYCGFKTSPKTDKVPEDLIRTIKFNDEKKMVSFIQTVQSISPVDSFVRPEPWDMPGYTSKVIMAAGTFIQGSSIEFSCDGPIKPPYIAYMQGGLTYEHVKIAALYLLKNQG
ncbi:MAG: methionine gamma-lyase family protein [bacterium]|nr:methionine gamma-lyase family protein [bacterium]